MRDDWLEKIEGRVISNNLNAYYYGFDRTMERCIDLILAAIAQAGKSYHHTDDWDNDYNDGTTPISRIQEVAKLAAAEVKRLRKLVDGAKEVVEIFPAKSPAQEAWKREWIEKAREVENG